MKDPKTGEAITPPSLGSQSKPKSLTTMHTAFSSMGFIKMHGCITQPLCSCPYAGGNQHSTERLDRRQRRELNRVVELGPEGSGRCGFDEKFVSIEKKCSGTFRGTRLSRFPVGRRVKSIRARRSCKIAARARLSRKCANSTELTHTEVRALLQEPLKVTNMRIAHCRRA
eukprot:1530533-Prymnesium_polylepis.1